MKRNRIESIQVHPVLSSDGQNAGDRLSRFHADFIERCLNTSSLNQEQKQAALDAVIQLLRAK